MTGKFVLAFFFVLLFFCLKINIHFASVFSEIISIFASLTNYGAQNETYIED